LYFSDEERNKITRKCLKNMEMILNDKDSQWKKL
jgi:hypothetical protein